VKWFLFVILVVLGLNLVVILLVGAILLSDWVRGHRKKPDITPFPGNPKTVPEPKKLKASTSPASGESRSKAGS